MSTSYNKGNNNWNINEISYSLKINETVKTNETIEWSHLLYCTTILHLSTYFQFYFSNDVSNISWLFLLAFWMNVENPERLFKLITFIGSKVKYVWSFSISASDFYSCMNGDANIADFLSTLLAGDVFCLIWVEEKLL